VSRQNCAAPSHGSSFIFPKSNLLVFAIAILVLLLQGTSVASDAAAAPNPDKTTPDLLLLSDGEQLIGKLQRVVGGKLFFHRDALGDVNLDLGKVQELRSSQKFAVIKKGTVAGKKTPRGAIPQGTIAVAEKQMTVDSGKGVPAELSLKDIDYVIDQRTFNSEVLERPSFLFGWTGAITAGATGVQATQNSDMFNTAVAVARVIPIESWLQTESRTIFNFNTSYGKLTQPGTPAVKTSILHGDGEHDVYFSSRLFSLEQFSFDHNYSLGLNLQQIYGAGIGFTAIKDARQELALRVDLHYEKQQFNATAIAADQGENQDLIGSNFSENYSRKLPRNILFTQQALFDPAWNNLNAYSASGNTNLALPIYKRFSVSLGFTDNFINNPPVGFKKNSVQFTTGITYKVGK
jgi:hypothetical protein